jgi:D-alanyl-lipoteichoic acid acyltransferase DltB (MBOAT superfamily)
MFRLMIYLYEMKHAKKPERPGDVISYFFLLPNFAFHLFPVIDYRTLRRGYFAIDIHESQRTGLRYLLRGTTHLLLWRLIYHDVLPKTDEVHNLATLALFVVSNYLLYLRVSGQFHLACGLLHLFGYKLPETHHHYFLATSFTDYWRRINIYWKDFMVKMVFNPVAFRLKRLPQAVTLSIATVCVFLTTWLTHGYQAFWLRGSWGFTVPDALFWGILGLFVVINVLNDARQPRARRHAPRNLLSRATLVRGLKVVATFTTIAVLWSLWSSPSLENWLDLLRRGFS